MADNEFITRIRDALKQHASSEIVATYLYGSQARGTARADSDIDLAILSTTPAAPRLSAQPYGLAVQLEGSLGREVDLVELNTAPPDLVHEVLRDGIIVLDRDADFRVRFEVRARAEYLDLLPVLRRYRAARAAP